MKFGDLLSLVGSQSWFDLASLVQLSGDTGGKLGGQLHRWCKNGKLIPLRRGMYAFSSQYRRKEINAAQLANQLYAPSYLSTHWALGFYGLIPEKTVTFTSVTARVPRAFDNPFGVFSYRHVKPTAFFGYRRVILNHAEVLMAEPEKALLDFWHLESGLWHRDRMVEMRFQNVEIVDVDKLADYVERFTSPRLKIAVGVWIERTQAEQKGTVLL